MKYECIICGELVQRKTCIFKVPFEIVFLDIEDMRSGSYNMCEDCYNNITSSGKIPFFIDRFDCFVGKEKPNDN